jgi:hypothetical protein
MKKKIQFQKPAEEKYPVGPWLLGLFVFVVCGSGKKLHIVPNMINLINLAVLFLCRLPLRFHFCLSYLYNHHFFSTSTLVYFLLEFHKHQCYKGKRMVVFFPFAECTCNSIIIQ